MILVGLTLQISDGQETKGETGVIAPVRCDVTPFRGPVAMRAGG